MASKTISINLEAYERLRQARRHPKESFSQVIRRGHWEHRGSSARSWLESFSDVPEAETGILESLEEVQRTDAPPEDKWTN